MFKKISFLLFFICLSFSCYAKEVAVVNLEDIAKNSIAIEKLNKKLESEKEIFQKKFQAQELSLASKRDEITSKASIFSKEVLEKKTLNLQKEILEFQESVKKKEIELQDKMLSGLSKINDEIKKIISNMLKEDKYKKYGTVINSATLLYFESSNDISSDVLLRLNKTFKEVK